MSNSTIEGNEERSVLPPGDSKDRDFSMYRTLGKEAFSYKDTNLDTTSPPKVMRSYTYAKDEGGICQFKTKENFANGGHKTDKVYVNNHSQSLAHCWRETEGRTDFDDVNWSWEEVWDDCGGDGWDDRIAVADVPCGKKLWVKDEGSREATVHGPYRGYVKNTYQGIQFPPTDSIDVIEVSNDDSWATAKASIDFSTITQFSNDNREYCDIYINTEECIDFCKRNPTSEKCKLWTETYCYENRHRKTAVCDEALPALRDAGLAKYCFNVEDANKTGTGNPQSGDATCKNAFLTMPAGSVKTTMQQKALLFCKAKHAIVGDEFCENLCKKDTEDGGFACDAELNRECTNGGADRHGFCSCYLPREEIPNFRPDKNPVALFGTPCLYDKCQTTGYRNRNHQDMLKNTCPDCIQTNIIENSTVTGTAQSNTCLNQNNKSVDGKETAPNAPAPDTHASEWDWNGLKSRYKSLSTLQKVGVWAGFIVLVMIIIGFIIYIFS